MVTYNLTYPVPRPLSDADNEQFWRAVEEGRLEFQRCVTCKEFLHPPRPMCHRCNGMDMEYVESSGRGIIYSFVTYERAAHPGFNVPYDVVLVEMEEGVRIMSNMVEGEEPPWIGMPVEVVIERPFPDMALPKFRRRVEE